ncbi:MAG TPA: hypothetical protein VJ972_01230 [Anaerolineales bacterium]|nr:hypothetical protein [Anaerolineales bacterium]
MDTLRPFQKIASKFQISEESAKYFLGRVQKSFKKEKPPHMLILDFIEEQGIDYQPEPYDIASMMHENGLWVHALNSPPPLLVDDEDLKEV